jgi:hypothetical protein
MITTIAIPTKDRPALLRRAARAYIQNAQRYGHRFELLVVDGSTNPAKRNANREGLVSVSRETGHTDIRYISTREVKPYVGALGREGADKDLAMYALGDPLGDGFNAGAARNALLLDTVGKQVLSVDDDTTAELAFSPQHRLAEFRKPADPTLTDDPLDLDPTDFWFFDSRDEAIMKARSLRKGVDVLKAFSSPLGRVPTDIKHEYESKDHAVRGDLRAGETWISQAGVLGDAGFSWSAYPLLKGGLTMANLRAKVKLSREVMRVPAGACVQAAPFCLSQSMGLDNTKELPPFLPVHVSNGRGGENLYGSIMRSCYNVVVVAFIPFALVHDPADAPKFTRSSLSWGMDIRLHDVLVEALRNPHPRYARAGAHVQALAGEGFEDWLRASMKARGEKLAQKIVQLKGAYRSRDVPNGWHTAIETILGLYDSASKKDDYPLPKDLSGTPAEVIELTRKVVSDFGKLLESWQDLRTKALDLRMKHGTRMSLKL